MERVIKFIVGFAEINRPIYLFILHSRAINNVLLIFLTLNVGPSAKIDFRNL